jgi:uncharacterized protein (TIGR02145 family)
MGFNGLGRCNLVTPNYNRSHGLPAALKAKFLFLWTGKYDGDDLLSDLDSSVITVTGKNWSTKYIPPDTEATFAVPDNATYLAADGTDDWWFNGAGVLQQKTHANLIISTTTRTFIKYADFEPYDVSAIGILKTGEVLTESDKVVLNKFFKLWVQYWGETMMESGYMKDNRTFVETDPPLYGLFYNWYVVNDARNIASNGWHVPTYNDIVIKRDYINPNGCFKLRTMGLDYWTTNEGTNELGFNAIGAGYRTKEGVFDAFQIEYDYWSATLINTTHPYHAAINVIFEDFVIEDSQYHTLKSGLPIRFVKNSTTLAHGQYGVYVGNDGRIYRTICIGTQEWLADNLCETKYRNGDAIPEVTNTAAWAALSSGALCAYNNDWSNVYG